ncbi:MAG TPA: hypothetical protein VFX21_10035 [Acidimicrobiia bacterium]|nr:hypothetical protein [Acidimicrobiia bacterium]
MSNLQLHWTEAELLATDDIAEPLIANGVHCHGGYRADGSYVSPRTKHRVPAIDAWQQSHREQFGTEIIDAPIDMWPPSYPSVAQTKYLIREGVAEPTIATLTRVGTVEGFGGLIRAVHPGDMQRFFDDSIDGTALQHLDRGLFEAHARDEAGWEDEAGHNKMWFAARDIAFDNPVSEDQTQIMLERMGIAQPGGAIPSAADMRASAEAIRRFPELDLGFEMMLRRMISLMFIEVSAFHTFRWAEEVLSDDDLVAGDGEAARIISCVRADETPHVDYLRTALTEVRDRTVVTENGKKIAGADVIQTLWDIALSLSLGENREQFRKTILSEIEHALAGNTRSAEILEGFHALDPVGVAS